MKMDFISYAITIAHFIANGSLEAYKNVCGNWQKNTFRFCNIFAQYEGN